MAIGYDNATDGGNNLGNSNSHTFAHTVGSGSDRLLVVAITGDVNGGADDITGVTYATISLTPVDKLVNQTDQNRNNYLYALLGPASGANDVVVSCTGTHYLICGAASYTGVQLSAQPDAHSPVTHVSVATPTDQVVPITTVADNCWTLMGVEGRNSSNNAPLAGAGTTRRTYDAAFGLMGIFDSNADITPAGPTSLSWHFPTDGSASDMNALISSWVPAGAGGATAALTGTALAGITETDIVAGSKTIIATLTGDTFIVN